MGSRSPLNQFKMKKTNFLFILLFISLLFSCNQTAKKTDEAVINNSKRAKANNCDARFF